MRIWHLLLGLAGVALVLAAWAHGFACGMTAGVQ